MPVVLWAFLFVFKRFSHSSIVVDSSECRAPSFSDRELPEQARAPALLVGPGGAGDDRLGAGQSRPAVRPTSNTPSPFSGPGGVTNFNGIARSRPASHIAHCPHLLPSRCLPAPPAIVYTLRPHFSLPSSVPCSLLPPLPIGWRTCFRRHCSHLHHNALKPVRMQAGFRGARVQRPGACEEAAAEVLGRVQAVRG